VCVGMHTLSSLSSPLRVQVVAAIIINVRYMPQAARRQAKLS